MDVPLTEYDACINDIRIPARTSSRVMIQRFRIKWEGLTNQSMYMTQRSIMAAEVSGVPEWSICMWWCEWSILVAVFRIWLVVGSE